MKEKLDHLTELNGVSWNHNLYVNINWILYEAELLQNDNYAKQEAFE